MEDQNAIHDAAAARRFPGPDYYEVLRWLHEELKPKSYVEIGVMYGESLKLAAPPAIALGLDPSPMADHPWKTPTRIVPLTSTEFFEKHDLRDFLSMDFFSLAFIDGAHLFEQVVEDFLRLERYAAPHSLVALHDTIPLDEETASRRRTTEFHTGDVWKVVPFLKRHRPDLDMITVRTAPTGLTLLRRLNPAAGVPAGMEEFLELPWTCYAVPDTIANQRAAVLAWLRSG